MMEVEITFVSSESTVLRLSQPLSRAVLQNLNKSRKYSKTHLPHLLLRALRRTKTPSTRTEFLLTDVEIGVRHRIASVGRTSSAGSATPAGARDMSVTIPVK
ncbi:unnamed protein product [Amoebophrya sp. A25]|nr:unnamed protein product [Amoebophrya sp. A25]|eukprot:GSA25T00012229001.1